MRFRLIIEQLNLDLQRIDEKYSKLSKKQKKLAAAAPPPDKITGADFKALRDKKQQKNENLEETELDETREENNESKLTRGYKANRSKSSHNKLSDLTKRYRDAKKTPGKADDMAAIKARDRFEAGQNKSKSKSKHNYKNESDLSEIKDHESMSELIEAMADELLERKKISKKVHNSLKKKAKDRNAPLGALKAIYRKGMGAFYSSGSRSGQNPHSWAMGRVNSVLRGGKARSVDKAQWKQIQKHRKKKRKKKWK